MYLKKQSMKIDKNKTLKDASGFTIIELMIATTIFSMVLVVMLASFMQIARMFYKGVSISGANAAARSLVEEVVNDVRFASQSPIACDSTSCPTYRKYFCVGNHRYTYITAPDRGAAAKVSTTDISVPRPTSINAGIVQDTVSGCPSLALMPLGSNPRQMLGLNMQLNDIEFKPANNGVFIHAHVLLYGADSNVFASDSKPTDTPAQALLEKDAHCSGSLLDTQLCAMADFKTLVAVRN
jgi:prepilin-type N-terminal cleavage/methylation domain-containing protein